MFAMFVMRIVHKLFFIVYFIVAATIKYKQETPILKLLFTT